MSEVRTSNERGTSLDQGRRHGTAGSPLYCTTV
jgi:hypothetical protein